MHELSVATEVHRVCRARLDAGLHLESVRLAVGELAAIEPDLLRFAWEAVTAGGPDEGAVLEIEWRPVQQVCRACGAVPERAPGTWLRLCPRCEQPLALEGGRELQLLSFSFAAAPAAAGSPS